MDKQFCVYIITNKYNSVFYTGVTSNLIKRIYEHKNKLLKGFTSKYNCDKLVWYEMHSNAEAAIKREKQLKGGSRKMKIKLVNEMNRFWNDLYANLTG